MNFKLYDRQYVNYSTQDCKFTRARILIMNITVQVIYCHFQNIKLTNYIEATLEYRWLAIGIFSSCSADETIISCCLERISITRHTFKTSIAGQNV